MKTASLKDWKHFLLYRALKPTVIYPSVCEIHKPRCEIALRLFIYGYCPFFPQTGYVYTIQHSGGLTLRANQRFDGGDTSLHWNNKNAQNEIVKLTLLLEDSFGGHKTRLY